MASKYALRLFGPESLIATPEGILMQASSGRQFEWHADARPTIARAAGAVPVLLQIREEDGDARLARDARIGGVLWEEGTLLGLGYEAAFADPSGATCAVRAVTLAGRVAGWSFDCGLPPEGVALAYVPGSATGARDLRDGSVLSFTETTFIDTPAGPRRIEHLSPGTLIITMDHGLQPIRWMGRQRVPGDGEFAPVLFEQGAIGNRRPLRLAPQHRVLIRNPVLGHHFGLREALIPAIHLVNGTTIRRAPCEEVDYIHLLCNRHEIIRAEGAPCETLLLCPATVERLGPEAAGQLGAIFPDLAERTAGVAAAKPCLGAAEARVMAAG